VVGAYTNRVGWGTGTGNTNVQLGTVAPKTTHIVRDIVIDGYNTTAEHQVIVYGQTGSGTVVLWRGQVPINATVHVDLRQTFYAGDTYFLSVISGAETIGVVITAYVFDAP
jgi:hypothetical protein